MITQRNSHGGGTMIGGSGRAWSALGVPLNVGPLCLPRNCTIKSFNSWKRSLPGAKVAGTCGDDGGRVFQAF
jgi:hypothetical protein